MNYYLVKDWTNKTEDQEPKLSLLVEPDVWPVIDAAKQDGHKIAVYKVGDCVLDWS